jgi:hypothetical protein
VKVVTAGVIVVVLLGVGALWLRDHDRRMAETRAARHSADSLQGVVTRDRAARATERATEATAAAARIAAADRRAQESRAAAQGAAARYTFLLDSLAAVSTDTATAGLIGRLRAGWAESQRLQDSALSDANARVSVRDVRIAELETARTADLAACEAQVDEALNQLRAANARTQPGLLTRVVRAVPIVLGIVGGWELGKRLLGK